MRILSVADAFDAMTNDRVYRRAIPIEDAIKEIKHNAGTQFDPNIAELFVRLAAENRKCCSMITLKTMNHNE